MVFLKLNNEIKSVPFSLFSDKLDSSPSLSLSLGGLVAGGGIFFVTGAMLTEGVRFPCGFLMEIMLPVFGMLCGLSLLLIFIKSNGLFGSFVNGLV